MSITLVISVFFHSKTTSYINLLTKDLNVVSYIPLGQLLIDLEMQNNEYITRQLYDSRTMINKFILV